jgi:hypothetical protein
MRKQMVAAVLSMAVASMAAAGEQDAYTGVAADAVSTGAALAAPGIGEANPLGWATVPIRIAIIQHAKSLPREQGQPMMDAVSASGWGAAANNLLVLAGASAAAPLAGLAIGYAVWKSGETEREFWRMCAVHKSMDPQVKCEFRAWKPEEVMRVAQEEQAQRLAAAQAPVMLKVSAAAGELQQTPAATGL